MSAGAAVTGLGVAAPNGLGTERFWAATLRGQSGITPINGYDTSSYPTSLAGQVPGFDAADHIPGRLMPQTDRVTRLALAGAQWALADSGIDPARLPEYGMGVVTSNASGGFEFTHNEIRKLWTVGSQHVSVYESFAWFYAVNTGQISIRHGMRGPSAVLVSEQAGGLDAVGHARRTLRGGAELVVTGGMDSALDPWAWVCHLSSGRISREPDPQRAYLPFDQNAAGYVPGEGGAILVLEALGRMAAGGTYYGEIAGYAASFDPKPGSGRPSALRRAAQDAIADARLTPGEVDVVFADATGVPELDRAEAEMITEVFGPYGVPVTAPKTMTGRLYAGGSALDLVTALLSIRDGVIPPTTNVQRLIPEYRMDLVLDEPRRASVRAALVLARGAGGFNSAIVVVAPSRSGAQRPALRYPDGVDTRGPRVERTRARHE
jgi:minimal PKS chain-length factor (CLF/KS beta)